MKFGSPPPLQIDWVSPINWQHPLNRGLVGWWMGVPGATGGPILHDLTRIGGNGTLTSGPTWDGPQAPDGSVSIAVTGGSYIADTAARAWNVDIPSANAFTVTFWMWNAAYASYECIFEVADGTTGSNRIASLFVETSSSMFTAIKRTAGGSVALSPSLTTSEWQRIGFSFDGTTVRIWRNGLQIGSTTSASVIGSSWGFGDSQDLWGFNRSTGGANASASYASRRTYARALSAEEMAAEYVDAMNGFPKLLVRQSLRNLDYVAAAPPATNRRRRVLMCARAA